jgi:hypothetical protein
VLPFCYLVTFFKKKVRAGVILRGGGRENQEKRTPFKNCFKKEYKDILHIYNVKQPKMSVMFFPEFMFHFDNWKASQFNFLKNDNPREIDIYKHLEQMPRPETKQQAEYILEYMTGFLNRWMKMQMEVKTYLNIPGTTNPEHITGSAVSHLIGYAKKKYARKLALEAVVRVRKTLQEMINAMVFQDDTLVIISEHDGKINDKEYEYKKAIDRIHTCDYLVKNSFDIIHYANKFRKDTCEDISPSEFYSHLLRTPQMREILINRKQEVQELSDKIEKQNRKYV